MSPTPRRPPKAAPNKAPKATPAADEAPAPPAPDTRSLDQWLSELSTAPHTVTAFGREWIFKQPTAARADRWDTHVRTQGEGVRAALASMMADETPSADVELPDPENEGGTITVKSPPGSARADDFLTLAYEQVPRHLLTEFWARFQSELFDVGEA